MSAEDDDATPAGAKVPGIGRERGPRKFKLITAIRAVVGGTDQKQAVESLRLAMHKLGHEIITRDEYNRAPAAALVAESGAEGEVFAQEINEPESEIVELLNTLALR